MRDKLERTAGAFRSVYQRRRELTTKLLQNPFFPILFIGEVVKTAAIAYATVGTIITPAVQILAVLAICVTILWLFAEIILESASEYAESAVETGSEKIDEATNDNDD